jgi:hypothetical protein
MAVGMFRPFQRRDHDVTLCRNVLKLRKEKKSAQEQEEVSATGVLTSHGQRSCWSGQQIDGILSENHAAQSERKPNAEQDDWREVCLLPVPYLPR